MKGHPETKSHIHFLLARTEGGGKEMEGNPIRFQLPPTLLHKEKMGLPYYSAGNSRRIHRV